ncbi:hypothetical protein CQW23_30327 [Capsicum baccatum]|uniref:Uncharacterized protein n=1 Tax=Capsicum baccatum TaxID=33114 RepID=A0A2G2VAX1_CAPBA|nr:hypothetical protein CQW23_30327 [Capsicum baccatum]
MEFEAKGSERENALPKSSNLGRSNAASTRSLAAATMVIEEVELNLNGYVIPKNTTINFMAADIGLDPQVWENPLDFNPDRFLSVLRGDDTEAFDITGVREIKVMPFGAGRRAVDGNNVDLSEKLEFTVTMKNPLCARICRRLNQLE